jgi:hypothetical protein
VPKSAVSLWQLNRMNNIVRLARWAARMAVEISAVIAAARRLAALAEDEADRCAGLRRAGQRPWNSAQH